MTEPDVPPIAERPARSRRIRQLAALLIAAVLIGLLAAWLSRGEFEGRYAVPEGGQETLAPIATASPAPSRPQPEAAAPVASPVLVPPDAENNDAASGDENDQQRIADAIEHAARKALDRGEPVRWHKAGESGYVVVSEARDIDDHTCRNVSATVEGHGDDDGQTQSNSHMWCLSGEDGDWQPMG